MLNTLNDEGTEAALVFFAEDFRGVVPPELSAEPDEYNGHDGVRRYFDSFHEIVAELRFDAEALIPVKDDVVAAHGLITGHGRESGIPVEMRVPMVMRLRGGKLVEMSAYPDWDEAMEAAEA